MTKSDTTVSLILVLLAALLSYALLVRPHEAAPDPAKKPNIPAPKAKLQLIYATSKTCIWCDRMERNTLSQAKVQERLARDFTFAKVSGKDAETRYSIKGYPSYLILNADGNELRRGTGYRTPEEFLMWLDQNPVRDTGKFTPAN